MKVLKFGGASVKDAEGVKNLKNILKSFGYKNTVLVISAMGKITNAFEQLIEHYLIDKKCKSVDNHLDQIKNFHNQIIADLFPDHSHVIYDEIVKLFEALNTFLKVNQSNDYDFVYDQVVGYGELLSTKICSTYLNENGIENKWLDIRKNIRTNNNYRQAKVDWEKTCKLLEKNIDNSRLSIVQGFIACDSDGNTTTLGREGSDYTAAIIAYCLKADEVQIYKDVPGILNADPKVFNNTTLLNQISYQEAIELTFYGASVIHPKTLQPLQRKRIPLFVKSFNEPKNIGTKVKSGIQINPKTPCFIIKNNQILLSISDREFHFIMEEDMSEIFNLFYRNNIKVNVIQNSAISLSVCIEDNFNNFDTLLENLQQKYRILYNKNLILYTIRHFNKKSIAEIENGKTILLKQLSRETAQILVKS